MVIHTGRTTIAVRGELYARNAIAGTPIMAKMPCVGEMTERARPTSRLTPIVRAVGILRAAGGNPSRGVALVTPTVTSLL